MTADNSLDDNIQKIVNSDMNLGATKTVDKNYKFIRNFIYVASSLGGIFFGIIKNVHIQNIYHTKT